MPHIDSISDRTASTRKITIAAIALVLLVAAACGDDDSAPAAAGVEGSTTTEAPDVTEATTTTTAVPEAALSVTDAELAAAIACGDPGDAGTVLLIHGTGTTPEEAFEPSLSRVLPAEGFEVCTVALPERATVDVQDSTEYVVGAVRRIHERTGEPVALVAHSQGVLEARVAVAFWPDVADATSTLVAIAGPNAGSPTAGVLCAEACAPALWQMLPGSALLAALDEAWDPEAIPVTAIRSLQDEFVPPESAAAIPGATVITVQDHCPDRVVSHAGLLADPIAYAALTSALAGGGTSDPAALDGIGCDQTTVEGMDIAALDAATAASLTAVLGAETVPAEPPVSLTAPGSGA